MATRARNECVRCAKIGEKAVGAVGFSTEPDELATSIYDLVADLLHLARENDIEPDYILHMAQLHFDAEVMDEYDAANLE